MSSLPGLDDDLAADQSGDSFWTRFPRPNWWQSALSIVVGIAIWQFVVDVWDPDATFLKSPTQVWDTARILAEEGILWTDIRTSLQSYVLGFVIGAVIGIAVGVALGSSRRLNTIFGPWITILYTVPIIAVTPLFILWIGFGLAAKVTIIALATFFPIVINTRAGAQSVDSGLHDVCTAFRASRVERFRYVIIPGSVPYILAGLRLSIGRSLIALVFADFFGATAGIGYLILNGSSLLRFENVYLGVVLLSVLALTLTAIVSMFERRFASYRTSG